MLKLRIVSRLGRMVPAVFWQWYGLKARHLGFSSLYLILSFDCDRSLDAAAAEEIDTWLRNIGLPATYAVPGRQLEEGASIYRKIAAGGAEFINHGALSHTEFKDGRWSSTTFYDEMPNEDIYHDVLEGHATIKRVLGITPSGFRAPHFGALHRPGLLEMLHSILRRMGYTFSTSTGPIATLVHGPAWDRRGIYEFPAMGSYSAPFDILDSWSHLLDPTDTQVGESYSDALVKTVSSLLLMKIPGLLNYYVDPSHVIENDSFFAALEKISMNGVQFIRFGDLVQRMDRWRRLGSLRKL